MPEHIQSNLKFLIISDTELWLTDKGYKGFEPVVREIESIGHLFNSITWIGYLNSSSLASKNSKAFEKLNIHFRPLKKIGGTSIFDKLKIVCYSVPFSIIILKEVLKADIIHIRAPSFPAFIGMMLSYFFKKKIWWIKYAGNWNETNSPFTYSLQRKILRKSAHSSVTINGKWKNQESHLLSFENPCLYESELIEARTAAFKKDFNSKIKICYAGNLAVFKGCSKIINALQLIKENSVIESFTIVGDGQEMELIKKLAEVSAVKVNIEGFQNREFMKRVYEESHIIILPSESEGFPKVIAEAAAYGCVPIVSNVSAIGQYVINNENGKLLEDRTEQEIAGCISELLSDRIKFKEMSKRVQLMASLFTYEYFKKRVETEILKR